MMGQEVEKRKKQTDSCTVSVNWQYVKESSPAFRRLMMLLLKPPDNQSAETVRADEERQNEQC